MIDEQLVLMFLDLFKIKQKEFVVVMWNFRRNQKNLLDLPGLSKNALLLAAAEGQTGLCSKIMHVFGAPISLARDREGRTPLFLPTESGHLGTCACLLDAGAGQEPDSMGKTPLFVAAWDVRKEVADILARVGGATHQPDLPTGCSPLSHLLMRDSSTRFARSAIAGVSIPPTTVVVRYGSLHVLSTESVSIFS